jgi:hypothetical protein
MPSGHPVLPTEHFAGKIGPIEGVMGGIVLP